MKKLVLAAILGLGVFGMLGVVSLNATENLSDEQFMQLAIDCANNQNKISCQSIIDNSNLEQCNKTTCNAIGFVFFLSADYKQAVKYYQKAADLGNVWGYNNLGTLYYKGQGVQQNFAEALKLYKKACDLNLADACYNLGILHYDGKSVKQDFVAARKHYKKACDLNHSMACNNLGYLYANAKGVKQNLLTAKKYYGKACDLGDQVGCDNYKELNEMGVK